MGKTILFTQGCGCSFFTATSTSHWVNLLTDPLDSGTLNTAVLLLSDKLLIDHSWRLPYDVADNENCVSYRIYEELIARGVIEEFWSGGIFDVAGSKPFLADSLLLFLNRAAQSLGGEIPQEVEDLIVGNPLTPLESLRDMVMEGNPPKPFDELSSYHVGIWADSIFSYFAAGNLCSRIHDPQSFFSLYLETVGGLSDYSPHESYDWALEVCQEYFPAIPLFQTKFGNPSRIEAPFDKPRKKTARRHRQGRPDMLSTMKNLEKLLSIRSSGVVRELREMYTDLEQKVAAGNVDIEQLPMRPALHRQWNLARAEIRQAVRPSKHMERWTDVLTIPASIASLFFPIVSAIPIATWIIGKSFAKAGKETFLQKRPWFFFAEQVADVALRLEENSPCKDNAH